LASTLDVVSVANATSPQLISSLSMEANLSYMQAIDATHVIGIGEDLSGTYTVQVALLNISDPTAPVETDHFDLEPTSGLQLSWGLSSAAQWDPHAVGYFPEYQTLAIPVYGTYTGPNWTGYESQLWVFNVDPNNGFTLEGQVTQDSQVERSIRIGDQLYAVADDSIDVVPIQNPTATPVEARIADQPRFPIYYPYWATPLVAYSGAVVDFSVASTAGLTATIAWGDGTSSTGTIAAAASGGFAVSGTHTYGAAGNFTPTVTFSRNGKTVDSLSGIVNVSDVTTPNAVYVDDLYQNLLGRHAEQGGMEYFGGGLTKGSLTRLQVVQRIMNSAEYRTDQINQFYVSMLGRQPDAAGLQGYLTLLASGGTLNEVRTIILGSTEFFHHVGGTNAGFLNALYLEVLGRSIDSTGATAFGSALSKGMTTRQVAATILASNESANDMVEGFYQEAFQRVADSSGLNTFTSGLEHGATGEQVLETLFASAEYWQKTGGQ
jgi:hypothetical protein